MLLNRCIALLLALLAGFIFLSSPLHASGESRADGESRAEVNFVDINVKEMSGLATPRPLTGGIPIAEGIAPRGSIFTLLGQDGKPVPCQSEVLATWKDGSARWVLLDFQAKPEALGSEHFRLVWQPTGKGVQPPLPVKAIQGVRTSISSGKVKITAIPGALIRISDRFDVKFILKDKQNERYEAIVEAAVVEVNGRMRSTMKLSGSFLSSEGKRLVDFNLRASVYAGLEQLYLEPQILINADSGIITYINDLSFEIVPLQPLLSASIGGEPGWKGFPSEGASARLFQTDDENYHFCSTSIKGNKAPGWMEISDQKGTLSVVLKDFWQQWPKSLEVEPGMAKIGLLPKFQEGAFSHMEPWYKHDYLFEGESYRLREGQSRRWQIWLGLDGDGEALTKFANQRLVPAADPKQAIGTGEWGFVAPAGSKGMNEYDHWAEMQFESYCRSIEEQRDYGAMNWGDWWGERGVNWGNHEYDTPLHILTQFARTGDPRYFHVAENAARHLSEVDVVHFLNGDLREYFSRWETKAYPSRPGMVHEHSIGHVGGFHPVDTIKKLYVGLNIGGGNPNPYLCLDPFNLGHIFTLGMSYYYLLTGDPWVKETVNLIGDNLIKLTEDGIYQFKGTSHSGRVNGWTMLALAGVYNINPTSRCLKAMERIADDALSEQNANCGGWIYKLSWGHCYCTSIEDSRKGAPSHVGEAGFIGSVRLNGLSYYYRLTGDPRIPESILRGVNHLNNDTWKEEVGDWRYTSCPATRPVGQIGVTIMALVNSININKDSEQLRILRKAWEIKFARNLKQSARSGMGKSYSTTMYGSPEAMNLYVNELDED